MIYYSVRSVLCDVLYHTLNIILYPTICSEVWKTCGISGFEIPPQTLSEDFFITHSVVAEARIELRAFRIQERDSTN